MPKAYIAQRGERKSRKVPDFGYLPKREGRVISLGLIESSLSRRGEVDGDDERELYFECCERVFESRRNGGF